MAPMPRLASCFAPLVVGAFVAALAAASPAAAQTEPAPATSPPAAADAPPPAGASAAEANAPTPPPPATMLAAPPPTPGPPMATAPGELAPLPPPGEEPPLYKQTWFWAVVGVVVLTATMITIGVASQGPSTPKTDLGDMRAF
jgi:hypothetical protein